MPFIIAGFLYLALTVPTLVVVGIVCRMHRKPVARALLAGSLGSAVGFVLGCGIAVLVALTLPGVGGNIGATALISLFSLSLAAVGLATGTALASRSDGS